MQVDHLTTMVLAKVSLGLLLPSNVYAGLKRQVLS